MKALSICSSDKQNAAGVRREDPEGGQREPWGASLARDAGASPPSKGLEDISKCLRGTPIRGLKKTLFSSPVYTSCGRRVLEKREQAPARELRVWALRKDEKGVSRTCLDQV